MNAMKNALVAVFRFQYHIFCLQGLVRDFGSVSRPHCFSVTTRLMGDCTAREMTGHMSSYAKS